MNETVTQPGARRRVGPLLKLVAGLFAALLVVYLVSPWLVPRSWLASRFCSRLSALMNRRTSIGQLDFQYGKGLSITALTIERRGGFGDGVLFAAEDIVIPLSGSRLWRPARMWLFATGLSSQPLDLIEIHHPQCWVIANAQGSFNISDLNDQGGARLPAYGYDIDDLQLHFVDLRRGGEGPEQDGEQLTLPRITARLDPLSGQMVWQGPTRATLEDQETAIDLEGELAVPTLKPDVQLGGGGTFEWHDLELGSLVSLLVPPTKIAAVQGSSSGKLRLEMRADLQISFEVALTLDSAELMISNQEHLRLPDGTRLQAGGQYDPNTEHLILSEVQYEAPGVLSLRKDERREIALQWKGTEPTLWGLALRGAAPSLDTVLARLESLGVLGTGGVLGEGPVTFEISAEGTSRRQVVRFELEGRGASLEAGQALRLTAGRPKRLSADLSTDGREGWTVHGLHATLGRTKVDLTGQWPGLPAPAKRSAAAVGEWFLAGAGRAQLEIGDLAEFISTVPALSDESLDLRASGVLTAEVALGPERPVGQAQLRLHLPASTALSVSDVFHKPAGRSLMVSLSANMRRLAGRSFEGLQLTAQCGRLQVGTGSEVGTLRLRAQVPASDWDRRKLAHGLYELSLDVPLAIENIEEGVDIFPGLQGFLEQRFSTRAPLAGHCRGRLQLHNTIVNAKAVTRLHSILEGGGLSVQIPQVFSKPAGRTCRLQWDYVHDARPRQPYRATRLGADLQGGEFEGFVEWSGDDRQGLEWTRRDVDFSAHIADAETFFEHWPRLFKQVSKHGLAGGGSFNMRISRRKDAEDWRCMLDLTPATIASTEPALRKSAGTALQIELAGGLRPHADHGHISTVMIDGLRAQLGASQLQLSDCRAEVRDLPASGPAGQAVPQLTEAPSPELQHLACTSRADVVFDGTLESVFPALQEWFRQRALSGVLSAEFKTVYQDGSWFVQGTADGTDTGFSLSRQLGKDSGTPAQAAFSVYTDPSEAPDAAAHLLHINHLKATSGENHVSLFGVLERMRSNSDWLGLQNGQLTAVLDLARLSDLGHWWQSAQELDLQGGLQAMFRLRRGAGTWDVDHAQVAFDDLRMSLENVDTQFDGTVEFERGAWYTEALSATIGHARARVVTAPVLAADVDPLELHVYVDEVDLEDLGDELQEVRDVIAAYAGTLGPAVVGAGLEDICAAQQIHAHLQLNSLSWEDAIRPVTHTLSEAHGAWACCQQTTTWELQGAFSGGLLHASGGREADDEQMAYALKSALPSDAVRHWLRFAFPGLSPDGEITCLYHTEAHRGVEDRPAEQPTATGELSISGGTLLGKAAPNWMTKVFPGLNLAAFEFSRMHDWFSEYPDGRVRHRAIFDGKYYNLYADGWELPGLVAEYVIGIDLLAGFDSKYWTDSSSGKIPLFESVSTLDEHGVVIQEDVSYVPLKFVKALLVGNNPVTAAYHLLRKRILDQD